MIFVTLFCLASVMLLYIDLRYKQQSELLFPSALDARNDLAPVTPERNILVTDVPVAGFQSPYQTAFG